MNCFFRDQHEALYNATKPYQYVGGEFLSRNKDFDNAKDRINKKANKELHISQWVNRMEANKMMRFNIICTDVLNDALYQFLSQNANRLLTVS